MSRKPPRVESPCQIAARVVDPGLEHAAALRAAVVAGVLEHRRQVVAWARGHANKARTTAAGRMSPAAVGRWSGAGDTWFAIAATFGHGCDGPTGHALDEETGLCLSCGRGVEANGDRVRVAVDDEFPELPAKWDRRADDGPACLFSPGDS